MHLLPRDTCSLDEDAPAEDLEHEPADIVFLSFVDSDLLAMQKAHSECPDVSLRLASLVRLRHPMSVDLYADQTISGSRCVIVRLLGGIEYWRYGVEELSRLCREEEIPLACIPGDGREDRHLEQASTVSSDILRRLNGFFREGGHKNIASALRLAASLAGAGRDDGAEPEILPAFTVCRQGNEGQNGRAVIVVYRAHVQTGEVAATDALADELEQRGIATDCVAVTSLRHPEAGPALGEWLEKRQPDVVLNATFFSARDGDQGTVLERTDCPVFQLLRPGVTEEAWRKDFRGLSPSDLAMQIVLPELDGRINSFPVSFRQEESEGLPAGTIPFLPGIRATADRAEGWIRLRKQPPGQRRVAVVLSDYPGAEGQTAHAVGLDTFASAVAILQLLREHGYNTGSEALPSVAELTRCLTQGALPMAVHSGDYEDFFSGLPEAFRQSVTDAWGQPTAIAGWRFRESGNVLIAVQPDRGAEEDRKAQYHNPDVPPCHRYIAFYGWLRQRADVMVHLGTHGTLEWLPGKTAALSPDCSPALLVGNLPVLYPFIVNNPGEAACARRRLGAVTISHLTPPMETAELPPGLTQLEQLIDEYAETDGLDRRRGKVLRQEILNTAARHNLLAESGVRPGETDDEEILARLDAYLCDVKDLQVRRGLHIFGRPSLREKALTRLVAESSGRSKDEIAPLVGACASAETYALLEGLSGRFVPPGPAGAPTRGRSDVLPTGRNLFTVDPRMLPTASAAGLARTTADLIRMRYLQEEGEPLRHMVLDLWGSATLRTGGEDLALAFHLMGVSLLREQSSGRISGFEIIPVALLEHPRVDVTLRISGLFRDAFPGQMALFDQAVQAIALRDEDAEWNPLAATGEAIPPRVFGPPPGVYGTGLDRLMSGGIWKDAPELGHAYIGLSGYAYGGGRQGQADQDAFRTVLSRADLVLHIQDHAETDLLDGPDQMMHEGGLAAAARSAGAEPMVLHGDTSRPMAPVLRNAAQEVARVVRGRLTSRRWLTDMQRHGYRGGAEIARGIEALCVSATLLPDRFDALFDACFDAITEEKTCSEFLKTSCPDAWKSVQSHLRDMVSRGLWQPRRNSATAFLDGETV